MNTNLNTTTVTKYEVYTGRYGNEIVAVPMMSRAISLLHACRASTKHPVVVGDVTYYPQDRYQMTLSDDMLARERDIPSIEVIEEVR
jgi:hypothetical protein